MYVVRHAEHVTPALAHLSRKGSLQATAIASTLKRKRRVVAVYSSPRSFQTARTISKELHTPITTDARLLPWDGGQLTGWSLNKVQKEMPEVYQKRFVERNPDFKVPDGESLNDRFQRVKSFLADVVAKHANEQIVVVTHGGIIDDLFRNARSLPPTQLTGLKKPYGSLSVLVFRNGRFHEELWGGVGHLPQVVAESPTGGQLYLFPHQVAGSFPMLRGDLGELCKPATEAEMQTYEAFPKECPEVAKFAPAFLGKVVIDVKHILRNDNALYGPLEVMHSPDADDELEDHRESKDRDEEFLDDGATRINGGSEFPRRAVRRESSAGSGRMTDDGEDEVSGPSRRGDDGRARGAARPQAPANDLPQSGGRAASSPTDGLLVDTSATDQSRSRSSSSSCSSPLRSPSDGLASEHRLPVASGLGDADPFARKKRRNASPFADRLLDPKRARVGMTSARACVGEDGESAMTDAVSLGSATSCPASSTAGQPMIASDAVPADDSEDQRVPCGGGNGASRAGPGYLGARSGSAPPSVTDAMQVEHGEGADQDGDGDGEASALVRAARGAVPMDDQDREWSVNTLWDRFIQHRKKKVVEVADGKFVYLVMENLTHGLAHPHILDIKMGTQQHGTHESAAKKLSKQLRVETTTSKTLGARVGGMQIYDEREHVYVHKDKYWGRSLDDDGLVSALRLFVTEQETGRIRTQVVKDIMTQLSALEKAIKSTFWHFYGCSVLIVFDGAMGQTKRERVSSSSSEASTGSSHSNPETSRDRFDCATEEVASIAARLFQQGSDVLGTRQRGGIHRSRSQSFDINMHEGGPLRPRYCVSVRLIDFAKTERNRSGTTYDTGMAFGLSNLHRLFRKILLESPCAMISRANSCSALAL